MNQEDIIRIAHESHLDVYGLGTDYAKFADALERFAALVAAAEREALEKMDWTWLMRQGALVTWDDAETLGNRVIAAIRARGQA